VSFVDLGAVTDPLLVPSAVVSTLGLVVRSADPIPGLLAFLQNKRTLLILDSCEHVIEAVAILAERIFVGAPESIFWRRAGSRCGWKASACIGCCLWTALRMTPASRPPRRWPSRPYSCSSNARPQAPVASS